ncbi:MAG: PDZ domain-containing protein [Verrucomicrobiae bacterium]|nr:PDZ domain-containing protein [Verrucomicrobiae bacterium]
MMKSSFTSFFAGRSFLLASVLVLFGLLVPAGLRAQEKPSPEKSLVRVNATLQSYNFLRPWEKSAPTPRRGLGAVLSGNRVLVTGELIVNSTYIELEHPSTGEKTPARIVGHDYEANLAVLAPIDESSKLMDELVPLEVDTSVAPKDTVEVWQVEDNGDGVITKVDVQRAAVNQYFIDSAVFLVYQSIGSLQARANSFTLPVIKDGKLGGMLLSYNAKEQISQVLAGPIIQAFLDDLAEGEYQGFPNLGIGFEQTLDDQLRRFARIDGKEGGIFVTNVQKNSSADKAGLESGDVIMAIGGHAIDSRGNYVHPTYGKLNFSHLVRGNAKVGDKIKIAIIRNGEPQDIDVTLERKEPNDYLIDAYMFDRGPRYLIMGGLIFQELTLPYLESWGENWDTRAPFKLVHANAHPEQYEDEGREKLVFLSQVLRTPSTLGYEELNSVILSKVNGQAINNLKDLSKAFTMPDEKGIHKIEFTDFPRVIYIEDRTSRAVNQQLVQYGISQMEKLD